MERESRRRRRASDDEASGLVVRPRRERNADESRRRILNAAEGEFARKGYEGARLRDVAIGAGVHHALLHHYYGDKQGLFRAVLERAIGAISSRALELLRTTPDIRLLLRRYVDAIVEFFATHQNLVQILHLAALDEKSPAHALCRDVSQKLILPLLEATSRTIDRAQKLGAVRRDIDARRLVVSAMGAAVYAFQNDKLFALFLGGDVRSPPMLDEHKEATIKLLMDGFLARDA